MPAEQHEHPGRPSDDGGGLVARTGPIAVAGPADDHGTQGVLACFEGFDVPVRRDLARVLADTPAGPELATLITTLDLEVLGAHDRVEVVAAAGRVESWAHAVKARAAAAVDRHPAMRAAIREPIPEGMHVVPERIAAATLALRLQASPREAGTLISEGRCYTGILAETGAALATGEIDVPRARVLVRRLAEQPGQVAWPVQAEVLPVAPGRTSHQVKQDVERALHRVDAEHAADRHLAARATRTVSHPQVRDDGMAGLWVVLPAETAVQVDTVLDVAARTARTAGDARTLAQLRADGLCDLVLHRGCSPTDAPDDGAAGPVPTSTPHPRTRILVTIPITTLMGLDDGPADLAGYGPIGAVQARALAWGGTWQRMLTDPVDHTLLDLGRTRYRPTAALADHVRRRDRTCAWPGCPAPAERCDLDHTLDYHPPPQDGRPPGTTSDHNLSPLCRNHHRLKTAAGFTLHHTSPGTYVWTDPTGHRYRVQPGTDHGTTPLPPAPPPF